MTGSRSGSVDLAISGQVAVLTLNRPEKLNTLTPQMTAELGAHVSALNQSKAVRAVILTGVGRAFCAGSDISTLDSYATPWEFGQRVDYGDIVRRLAKPAIAAINGYALGGGLELALACDIRIASEAATFAAPEIKLGWIGGSGQSALLVHSVGPSNAATMILTGDPIDAPTAQRWGLTTQTVTPEALMAEARRLADTIASRAPIAAQTAKSSLRAAHDMTLRDAIALERHLQTICFATDDAREGRRAFGERRTPEFTES